MNLTILLEKRSAIYGVCALWIMLFHVFRRISMPYIPVLTNVLATRIALLVGIIGFAIISEYTPILKNSVLVWSRLPTFTMGIWAADEFSKKQYKLSKALRIAALALILLIGTVISINELSTTFKIPTVYRNLLQLPMTLSLMWLLSANPMKVKPKVLERLGVLSLELYLVHITLLHIIKFYGIMDVAGYWLYLILPIVSAPLAWIAKKFEDIILNRV